MKNIRYRHIETNDVVDALSWSKSTYMDTRKELIRLGEIEPTENIPTDEEFIEDGIKTLESDERFERVG